MWFLNFKAISMDEKTAAAYCAEKSSTWEKISLAADIFSHSSTQTAAKNLIGERQTEFMLGSYSIF